MKDLEIPNYLNLSDHEKTEKLLEVLSSLKKEDSSICIYSDLFNKIINDNDVDRMHILRKPNVLLIDDLDYELYNHCYYENCKRSPCNVIDFLLVMKADINYEDQYQLENTPLAASIMHLNKVHIQKLLDAKASLEDTHMALSHEKCQLVQEFAHYF